MTASPTTGLFGAVLAAGSSSRLGQPKQLLRYRDQALVDHAVRSVEAVAGAASIVILGCDSQRIREGSSAIRRFAINSRWSSGLASSLQCAVRCMPGDGNALLVTLCDQPLVDAEFLSRLCKLRERHREDIAATAYADGPGVPAILPCWLLEEILGLAGDTGARALLQCHSTRLRTVPAPEGHFDVDTPSDLTQLR